MHTEIRGLAVGRNRRRRKEGRKAGRKEGRKAGRKEGRKQVTLIESRNPHLAGV